MIEPALVREEKVEAGQEGDGIGYDAPVTEVIGRLRRYMAETGMSQPRTARAVGIAESTLSQVLGDKYPKIEESGVLAKIQGFLELERPPWKIIETANLKKIERVCAYAREQGKFCTVIGRAGTGKTQGLIHVRSKRGCFYVRVHGGSVPSVFLRQIVRALGGEASTHDSIEALLDKGIKRLQAMRGALLLIDEADRLSVQALELLRDIYDATECGIVLAALPRLEEMLRRGTSVYRNLEQITSRLKIVTLGAISEEECDEIVGQFRVRDHDQGAKAYIRERAVVGGMRKLAELITDAQHMAKKNGHRGAITLELLKRAEESLL